MTTREIIESELEFFKNLCLDDKLTFLYKEKLLCRYEPQLAMEEMDFDEIDDEDIDTDYVEDEYLAKRISELSFTPREMLFMLNAVDAWNPLKKTFGTHRAVATVLHLLTGHNRQVIANMLSKMPKKGLVDSDFSLKGNEEKAFFQKLASVTNPTIPEFVVRHFKDWNIKQA